MASVAVSPKELVRLGAADSEFYCRTFFPQTFRQESPPFAKEMWKPLEDPRCRLVNLLMFRGGRKTTTLRAFASKRIAYGISRTILFVGASESDAIRSVTWMKNRVERNQFWTSTFGLQRGKKWEETQCEIVHAKFGHTVNLLAAGVTGSLRGINFDDFRPDLIILDDPQTDEMASSEAQREKVTDLVLGAVRNSLAPETEEPNAKLAMAVTPQHPDDISQQARRDLEWSTLAFPCWTKETLDLDVDLQVSSWEARFPSTTLRSQKKAAIARNRLSVFAREMECRLISRETSTFRPAWLKIPDTSIVPPRGVHCVLGIDPVPPPSPKQMQSGLQTKDFEAHYLWGRWNGEYHLLAAERSRGHQPSWTIATCFGLLSRFRCKRVVFDAVAYQRSLKWLFDQEMRRRGIYFTIIPVTRTTVSKFDFINNTLSSLATNGLLNVDQKFTNFISQFGEYGPTYQGIDDDLDASALALSDLANPYLEKDEEAREDESDIEELPLLGEYCP